MDRPRRRREPLVVEIVHSGRVDVHIHGDPRVDALALQVAANTARIGELMAAQEDVDAAVAGIGGDVTRMRDAIVRIQAEIADLQSQGVDTSGLVAALASLDSATGDLDNIAPAPPVEPTP